MKEIIIYTDGSASPNPGKGGYGIVFRYKDHYKELSQGFKHTTNNRMELLAMIVALEELKESCKVKLYSDSAYIVNAITNKTVFSWQKNNWYRNKKDKAKNIDLWQRFLAVYQKHEVDVFWVKAHVGIVDNERCDILAKQASKQNDLLDDEQFLSS